MRVRWIIVVIASAIGLAGCNWPMFMENAAHTGASPDTSITAADLTAGLTEKWQGDLGPTAQQNLPSSAVAVGGVVYIGTADGRLAAFAADGGPNCNAATTPKTCEPLWSSGALTVSVLSTPAVANGLVYIGNQGGALEAFDAAGNGDCRGVPKICFPVWSSQVVGAIETSPVVAKNKVYIGSDDGNVYAYNAKGCGISSVCAPVFVDKMSSAVHSSPAVADGILYVGADGGNLFAFDALGVTGCSAQHVCLPLWRAPTGGAVKSSPSVADGRVFVGSDDGKVYAFDAAGNTGCVTGRQRTCSPLWTATTVNTVDSSPAVVNGVVYIGSDAGGSTAARLNAYDAAGVTNCSGTPRTCQPLWTSSALGIFGTTPISVANGIVYIEIENGLFSFVGSVHAFDASTPAAHCSGVPKVCTALWSVTPSSGDALGSAPSVADKFLYVGGVTLHAFAR